MSSETTLRIERLIPSPSEILFALWTEPAPAPEALHPGGSPSVTNDAREFPIDRFDPPQTDRFSMEFP